MVLCKYFQTDSCRFGSKCTNEHVDIKQLVRSDVENALNKNQWPLSCYGPFREKPCVPNFIDDQSFEEVRYLCYTSKKQNFFQQFHEQFTKEVMEAKTKMRALITMSADAVNILTNLYDTPIENKTSTVTPTNPFAASQSMSYSSCAGNLFNTNSTNSTSGNNLFSQNSLGGSFNNNNQQSQTQLFSQQPQQSIFASNPPSSIFPQQQVTQSAGIFRQPVSSQSGLFAQATQQMTLQQPQANPFGITHAQNSSVQNQLQPPPSGLFAAAAAQTQSQPPPSGLFAAAAAQTQSQPPPSGLFAATAAQTQSQPPPSGLFAAAAAQTQSQPPPSGLFAAAAAQTPSQLNPQYQVQSQNIFSQQQGMQGGTIPQQQQHQAYPQPQNTNLSTSSQNNVFESTIYSKMENLTSDEIEAFKADKFILGKLPFSPPPRDLV